MGNDGGSIPTRCELVREAARNPTTSEIKESMREHLSHVWTTCPVSHKELTPPIVSDSGGNLYNKDAILRYLLPGEDVEGISSKADCDEILGGRVKSIRDVVEVKFEVDENAKDPTKRFICPITQKALGPSTRSVYLVPCGHAFAEEAIREAPSDRCLQCNEPYTTDNIIPIIPIKESDGERLETRIRSLAEKGLTHSLKKASGNKKRKKHQSEALETAAGAQNGDAKEPSAKKHTKISRDDGGSGIQDASTAMLTAKVLGEQRERHKMRGDQNENLKTLYTSSKKDGKMRDADFMTRGYSIPAEAKR
ncbi:hypothetical protein KEM55_003684 [Ascosphaera atra]|nr:hypothetical protein KEM55_003684 [Ascosphaera atra]